MKPIRLTRGMTKTFWTLRFEGENRIDIGDCHGDGALHLWKTKKGALEEASSFDEGVRAIPTKVRIEVLE